MRKYTDEVEQWKTKNVAQREELERIRAEMEETEKKLRTAEDDRDDAKHQFDAERDAHKRTMSDWEAARGEWKAMEVELEDLRRNVHRPCPTCAVQRRQNLVTKFLGGTD